MKVMLVSEDYTFEPLGIGYLASSLKKEGHKPLYTTINNAIEMFNKERPEAIGFSVLTGSEKRMLNLTNRIKEDHPEVKTIWGGSHPSFSPYLIQEENIDYIIRGEGENAINEILEGKPSGSYIGKLVRDLDSISVDRDTINMGLPSERTNPIKHVITSRGCPFSCPYCYNDGFKKMYKGTQTVRRRSVSNVVNEVKELKKSGAKFIQFQDDAFTYDKKWLKEFSEEYKKILPFHAIVRLDQLDEEVIKTLKNAGVYSVRGAVEAGNDFIRNKILKRNMTKDQMRESCSLLTKHNIPFMLQNMLGMPEGTIESDMETLELNKELKPTYAWASLFQPYPGTSLGEKHKGIGVSYDINFFTSTPLDINQKEAREGLAKNFDVLVNGRNRAEGDRILYGGLI